MRISDWSSDVCSSDLVEFVSHAKLRMNETERGAGRNVIFLVGIPPHPDAGVDQEDREQVQRPCKVLDENGTDADHQSAQHEDAKYPPEQHSMLIKARYAEIAEDERDDEDVVERERLLDQKADEIFLPRLRTEEIGRAHV